MSLCGVGWATQFPTSSSTSTLISSFRIKVDRFITALRTAGATVQVNATLRPPQRAYLMHWSWRIAREGFDARQVPSMAGVSIQWAHKDRQGNYSTTHSIRAASAMVSAYGTVFRPSLTSRHTEGRAIDMTIGWCDTLQIVNASGNDIFIPGIPRNGGNTALHTVGASYGVIKLVSDPPHWSEDGR